MFEVLLRAGIDMVEADYDAMHDDLDLLRVAMFKGGVEVENESLVAKVWCETKSYLAAVLPDGWDIEAGSYGQVRLFTASGYATFHHVERTEEYLPFTRGIPGADVPDRDRW
ncbi:hypothetical protein [Urbifossiella limnaea]|uniref:hypothetical protein n=1 Tax=Urbifossiella limnaea TaxID=2528023 RepID=UPI00119DC811|nr:hypothetical protein [Urbifossiella limnaea]